MNHYPDKVIPAIINHFIPLSLRRFNLSPNKVNRFSLPRVLSHALVSFFFHPRKVIPPGYLLISYLSSQEVPPYRFVYHSDLILAILRQLLRTLHPLALTHTDDTCIAHRNRNSTQYLPLPLIPDQELLYQSQLTRYVDKVNERRRKHSQRSTHMTVKYTQCSANVLEYSLDIAPSVIDKRAIHNFKLAQTATTICDRRALVLSPIYLAICFKYNA